MARAQTLRASFVSVGISCDRLRLAPSWESAQSREKGGITSGNCQLTAIAPVDNRSLLADGVEENAGTDGTDHSVTPASTAAMTTAAASAIRGGRQGRNNGVASTTPDDSGTHSAIAALKLAVLDVTRRLTEDVSHLPLRDRTTAVLVDGSRMSLLALGLAGAAWKYGRSEVL